jgi:hypothetical protein
MPSAPNVRNSSWATASTIASYWRAAGIEADRWIALAEFHSERQAHMAEADDTDPDVF